MTTTECLGIARIGNEDVFLLFQATDGTAKEATFADLSNVTSLKNVRDHYSGKSLTGLWLQVAVPSDLDLIQLLDKDGGIVYEFQGNITAALGYNPQLLVEDGSINFPITKGVSIMVTTSD